MSPTKVRLTGETQFGFNQDVAEASSPRDLPDKIVSNCNLTKTEKLVKSKEDKEEAREINKVGPIPSSYDDTFPASFPSNEAFPSSFHNSNYPPSLGFLNTVESNNKPTPSRMVFDTGSYDTCAEYLTQAAISRHSETFYRTNSRGSSLPHHSHINSYYGSSLPSNISEPATATPPAPSSIQQRDKFRDAHETHNMSMELTFENTSLYGLAGSIPASDYDNNTTDHMDDFEPFEFLQCDSNISPRQPQSQKQDQHSRFQIPLLWC